MAGTPSPHAKRFRLKKHCEIVIRSLIGMGFTFYFYLRMETLSQQVPNGTDLFLLENGVLRCTFNEYNSVKIYHIYQVLTAVIEP